MKKNNFKKNVVCLSLVAVSFSMAAQEVSLNQQPPNSYHGTSTDDSGASTISNFSLDYYNFSNGYTDLNFVGLTFGAFECDGGGLELKFKSCIESQPGSGAGTDLLYNYCLGLRNNKESMLGIQAKAGPSFMLWSKYKLNEYYQMELDGSKFTVDCVLSLGLICRIGKLGISGGYNWWFSKFRFNEENSMGGPWFSIAYCLDYNDLTQRLNR